MVKNVYWTITDPFAFGGRQVVFLRFGSTGRDVDTRVNEWKSYCPLPLSLANNFPSIQSVDSIDGPPDDAIRSRLIALGFSLSQPATVIDWFELPVAQPGNNTVAQLVQAAVNLAGGNLTAATVGIVTNAMGATMNT